MVSVIVPVYNVSAYLGRCLDSITKQTYHDIEIILIDDGSTDNSGKICDEYAHNDDRISVIHKANGGVSSARNLGIEKFKGEFVMFVDSDDIIEPDMIMTLLENANLYKSEITCCLLDVIDISGKPRTLTKGTNFGKISPSEIITRYFDDTFIKDQFYSPVNKLFTRDLIKGHFFQNYSLGEDILFIFELLLDCKSTCLIDYIGYHYIHRENSAMTSPFSIKRLDYIYAGEEIVKLCKDYAPYALRSAEQWLYKHRLITLRQIVMSGNKDKMDKFVSFSMKELRKNNKNLANLSIFRRLDYLGLMYCNFYFSLLRFAKRLI